jgi:hypothetical protein
MVGSVQFFALTSGVSANLSSTYRGVSCNLNWFNFQVPILGVGQSSQCSSTVSSSTVVLTASVSSSAPSPPPFPPPLAGRRHLTEEDLEEQMHGRSVLQTQPPPPSLQNKAIAIVLSQDGPKQSVQDQIKSEYERMLMVGIVASGLVVFHQMLMMYWCVRA